MIVPKDNTKHCYDCKNFKPFVCFSKNKAAKDGLQHSCKDCVKANRIKNKNYYYNYQKNWWLKKKYGVSVESFYALLKAQNGLCAICKKGNGRLCLDHCHKSGKPRGILCYKCNLALGNFEDNVNNLNAAKQYLIEKG